MEVFEAATIASPDDSGSWANLSASLNALSEYEQALECARASSRDECPSSSVALAAQGASLLELGEVRSVNRKLS